MVNSHFSNAERLLYKNSCNLSAIIHLMTIHEDNTARFLRQQNTNDNSIVNLLNNVLNISATYTDLSNNTAEQIQNNNFIENNRINPLYLRELKYSDLSNCIYNTCPISRDTFQNDSNIIQIRSCGHYFKKDSFLPWLRQSRVCPYCRTEITSTDSHEENINREESITHDETIIERYIYNDN